MIDRVDDPAAIREATLSRRWHGMLAVLTAALLTGQAMLLVNGGTERQRNAISSQQCVRLR